MPLWPVLARKRDWRFHGLHPLFQLALLDLALASRCRGLEDVFLRSGLELFGHRLLKALLVLPDHASHAVELVDAPFVGARDTRGEQRLLCVDYFLKLIHASLHGMTGLSSDFRPSKARRRAPLSSTG
jgi:hypothetical protein